MSVLLLLPYMVGVFLTMKLSFDFIMVINRNKKAIYKFVAIFLSCGWRLWKLQNSKRNYGGRMKIIGRRETDSDIQFLFCH